MIVTRMESVNRTKVRVTVDDEVSWVMPASQAETLELYEGRELSEEDYARLYETCILRPAKEKALSMLERRDYTWRELYERLTLQGFPKEAVHKALDYVQSYHYIDDERYARNYLLYHSTGKSRKMVAQTLAAKGIDPQIVETCLEEWEDSDLENIRRLYTGKFSGETDLTPEKRRKILNYFLRKGYQYGDVLSVIKEFDSI